MARGAAIVECVVPLLWCCELTRMLGVALAVGMHVYIILMAPLGAVCEWNLTNLIVEISLFSAATPPLADSLQPGKVGACGVGLLCGIAIMCYVGPLVALVALPERFSNHFALRKYVRTPRARRMQP